MPLALVFVTALACQGEKLPPFQAGSSDVVFEKSPAYCDADELKARFRIKDDPPPYDVAKEKFRLIVPKSYAHSAKWGLLVYVNAGDDPGLPGEYEPVLEKHKLLAVAPYTSGNGRNPYDRFRMAIDANVNLQKRFNIDPKRVYVSGFSGGGRIASMLSLAYADIFSGGIPLCGTEFYLDIPSEPGRLWQRTFIPVNEAIKIAKTSGRFALMTGEKDMNLKNTRAVYEFGFKKEGYKHAQVFEVPGMGHSPPPAEWFDKGLNFLDNPK